MPTETPVIRGTILAESIKPASSFEGHGMRIISWSRYEVSGAATGYPSADSPRNAAHPPSDSRLHCGTTRPTRDSPTISRRPTPAFEPPSRTRCADGPPNNPRHRHHHRDRARRA
jgi:hypothetical protein